MKSSASIRRSIVACGAMVLSFVVPAAAATTERFPPVVIDTLSITDGQILTERDPGALVGAATLSILAGLDRQQTTQSGIAALVGEILLQTPVSFHQRMMPLVDAVSAIGGTIHVEMVGGERLNFVIEARSADLAPVLRLVAQVLLAPAFDTTAVQQAKDRLVARLRTQSNNGDAIATEAFREGYYRSSNAGLPTFGTIAQLNRLTPLDAQAFFFSAYRRTGTLLSLVGDETDATMQAAKMVIAALPTGASQPAVIDQRATLSPNTKIISYRNNAMPWIVVGFPAPNATSQDFGAMLLFSTFLETALLPDLASLTLDPSLRPVTVRYDYYSHPATMFVSIDGGGAEPLLALRRITLVVNDFARRELDDQSLLALKQLALGRFITENLHPEERASAIAVLAGSGLGADARNVVLRRIEAVTSADLQQVVRRYCAKYTLSMVVPHRDSGP